jgi:hypothetical protein
MERTEIMNSCKWKLWGKAYLVYLFHFQIQKEVKWIKPILDIIDIGGSALRVEGVPPSIRGQDARDTISFSVVLPFY